MLIAKLHKKEKSGGRGKLMNEGRGVTHLNHTK